MIGYFLVLGNRRGFCYGSSVQYGEEHVSIRPTFTAYLPDLSHFIIFIGRREQSSAEVERSSLSLSLTRSASATQRQNTSDQRGNQSVKGNLFIPHSIQFSFSQITVLKRWLVLFNWTGAQTASSSSGTRQRREACPSSAPSALCCSTAASLAKWSTGSLCIRTTRLA